MTKANESRYNSLMRAYATRLDEVYGRYSSAKVRAYNYCINKCAEQNGEHFRIISANTFQFTCGWTFEKDGQQFCHIETASNTYEFAVA